MITVRPVDTGAGDTVFWIMITVVLTLIFATRGNIRLLMNPIYAGLFIIALIIVYIFVTAFSIVYGVGDLLNSLIQTVAGALS